MDASPLERVALGPGRYADDGEGLAAVKCGACLGQGCRTHRHAHGPARVERLDNPSAELALVAVDDRDRNLAQNLIEIGMWVIDAVEEGPEHQQDEGTAQGEHALPLRDKGATDPRRRDGRR